MLLNITRRLSIVMLLALLVVTGSACSSPTAAVVENAEDATDIETSESFTITDYNGDEVSFTKPADSVIVLGAEAQLSIVKAIHGEDKIVGVNESVKELTDILPIMSQLPSIGSSNAVNYEQILELAPDVVIVPYHYDVATIKEKLEPDIQVVVLNIGGPSEFVHDVQAIGAIFDREKEAEEFLNWYHGFLDPIVAKTSVLADDEKVKVFGYYGGEMGMSEDPPYGTYGKANFWVNPSLEMAGGISISKDLDGDWISVDPEWIITENPEVIVREVYAVASGDVMGYVVDDPAEVAAMRESIMSQPEFESTEAAQTGRVYLVYGNLQQEYWYVSVAYLAKWFYPDMFADLDPQAIHQELLTDFMRIDYDLSEHGVFVYPEP